MGLRRTLIHTPDMLMGENEVVVEISSDDVGRWALEFGLLLARLSDVLVVSTRGAGLEFALMPTGPGEKRALAERRTESVIRFTLPQSGAGYIHAVLLRAYRDGAADVEHVHIGAMLAGREFDLTLFFDRYKPPSSEDDCHAP